MTKTLPRPLTDEACDLSGYSYLPLEIERLRRSLTWTMCRQRPELAFYLTNLWMAAWHSRPAASLEDDDSILSNLAMCDPARWPEVRAECLRGWIKCPDRRLYHPFLSLKASEVWTHSKRFRRAQSEKGKKSALARLKNKGNSDNHGLTGVEPQPNHGPTPVQPNSTNRREEKRRKEKKRATAVAADAASSEGSTAKPSPWTFGLSILTAAGCTERQARGLVGKWRKELHGDDSKLLSLFLAAQAKSVVDPAAYIAAAVSKGNSAGAAAPRELSAAEKRRYLEKWKMTRAAWPEVAARIAAEGLQDVWHRVS